MSETGPRGPEKAETAGGSGFDPDSHRSHRSRGSSPRRRAGNIEGAFPLLLLGSVLLIYCAILRSQTITAGGAHFPLWGIVGAVGAVVAGSGVYSLFLDTSEPAASALPDGLVLVSKAELDALRPKSIPATAPAAPTPPWWEGPPAPSARTPPRSLNPAVVTQPSRPESLPARPAVPAKIPAPTSPVKESPRAEPSVRNRTPSKPPPAPAPTAPPRKGSLAELRQALAELEDLVNTNFKSPSRPAPPTLKVGPAKPASCADCGRDVPGNPVPDHCAGCGRRLCVDCALASQFEDADLRCNECRARQS